MKNIILILLFNFLNINTYATEIKGSSTIVIGDNMTIDGAKKTALLNARIDALTRYGTYITVESNLNINELKGLDNYNKKINEITSSIVKTITISIKKKIINGNVNIIVNGTYYIDDDLFNKAINNEISRRTQISKLSEIIDNLITKENLNNKTLTDKNNKITELQNLLLDLSSKKLISNQDLKSIEEVKVDLITYTNSDKVDFNLNLDIDKSIENIRQVKQDKIALRNKKKRILSIYKSYIKEFPQKAFITKITSYNVIVDENTETPYLEVNIDIKINNEEYSNFKIQELKYRELVYKFYDEFPDNTVESANTFIRKVHENRFYIRLTGIDKQGKSAFLDSKVIHLGLNDNTYDGFYSHYKNDDFVLKKSSFMFKSETNINYLKGLNNLELIIILYAYP